MQKLEKCIFIGTYYFWNLVAIWKSLGEPAEDMQLIHPSQKPDMDKATQAQSTSRMIHKMTVVVIPGKINGIAQLGPVQIV